MAAGGAINATDLLKAKMENQPAQAAQPTAAADEWTCPKCGAANSGKFCTNCGEPKPTARFCPECGKSVDAGAKFCPNCGHKLS